MIIRKEKEQDYQKIYETVKEAFTSAEHSDGSEHELVSVLRKSDAYIPELSLIAEESGEIAGHIMFTKATINGKTELALAPLSILPKYQRKGIGQALITEGHKIAVELGYNYSIVLGSEKYYPKTGYVPASTYGIKAPFEVPDENFMAYKLSESAAPLNGTLQYTKEFFEV